jgi:hypothetical protein
LKKLAAAFAVLTLAAGLGAARASANGVVFGVNDNAGLYQPVGGPFWSLLEGENMSVNTIILRWDETTANGFQNVDGGFLPGAMKAAAAAGVQVEFAVSPAHSAELSDQGGPAKFAAWLTRLATAYPQVKSYVVMNECNQDLFVNPQYQSGQNVSAARCGTWLAAGYDALKAVNPGTFVWGLGLSPRGNPVPTNGADKSSTDPIDWLGFLGQWYKASGRTKPLMDGLDLHPYPIPQGLPFADGYANPQSYSVANLPRAYQAFYNAFNGTAQPTVGPGHLPVQLNEVGIQTAPNGHSGYTDTETSATAEGGVVPPNDSEAFQAQWYSQLVDATECDADITNVNIFKLIDESSLKGWQSGLYYVDGTAKASAAAVRNEIAKDGNACPTGTATYWAPGATVVGGVTPKVSTPAATATAITAGAFSSFFSSVKPLVTFNGPGSSASLFLGTAVQSLTFTYTVKAWLTGTTRQTTRQTLAADGKKPKKPKKPAVKKPVVKTYKFKKGRRVALTFTPKGLKDGRYKLVVSIKPVKGTKRATVTTAFTVKSGKFVATTP